MITGIGVVSPNGIGAEKFGQACIDGKSGIVRLAGSSAYFDRSIVAYSKEAKLQSLGVEPEVFDRSGAVSIATACAMADGLHRLSQADMVLAETGIAGPIRGRLRWQGPRGLAWQGTRH